MNNPPDSQNGSKIFLLQNGKKVGPFSEDQIHSMLCGGMLVAADFAWKEGMTDWVPLWQVMTLRVPAKKADKVARSGTRKNKFFVSFLCIMGTLALFGLGLVIAAFQGGGDEREPSGNAPSFSYDYSHPVGPSDRVMFRGESSSGSNIPFVSGNGNSGNSGTWGQYQTGPRSSEQDASAERAAKLKRETDSRYPVCPRCRGVGLEGRGNCPFCHGVGRVPVNR